MIGKYTLSIYQNSPTCAILTVYLKMCLPMGRKQNYAERNESKIQAIPSCADHAGKDG